LAAYRGGKTKLQGFFVGQLMKQSGGRVDPKLSNQLLSQKLKG
jgi:aspartyl-tRNA(Asn)/glutamyl-tRNA(Gln) amidotransferase subunit B